MRKFIFRLAFFLISGNLLSQTIANQEFTKEDYLHKSKNQNTAGWIFASTGTVLLVIGVIGFGSSKWDDSSSETDAYGYMMIGGPIIGLGSVPFFISSGRNKKRAMTLTLSNQPIFGLQQYVSIDKPAPSLTFKIIF